MNEGSWLLITPQLKLCLQGPRLVNILSRGLMNLLTEGPISAGSTWRS